MEITRFALTGILLFSTLIFGCADRNKDQIIVRDAWIREAPPNAMVMAGYLTVENHKDTDLNITGVKSESFEWIELHRSMEVDGVASMVPQESIPVPAGGSLELKPGGFHLMMMNATSPLKEGDQADAALTFDDGAELAFMFQVKKM